MMSGTRARSTASHFFVHVFDLIIRASIAIKPSLVADHIVFEEEFTQAITEEFKNSLKIQNLLLYLNAS